MADYNYKTAHGFLTSGERELLKTLASKTPRLATIVNIGVEYGASLACLYAGNPTAILIGIDIDNTKCEVPILAKLLTGRSQDLVKDWKYPPNMTFIDGEHSYEAVLSDLGFVANAPIGGLLALHDCCYENGSPHSSVPGVDLAVNAWKEKDKDWVEIQHVDTVRAFERKFINGNAAVVGSPADLQPSSDTGTSHKRSKRKSEV